MQTATTPQETAFDCLITSNTHMSQPSKTLNPSASPCSLQPNHNQTTRVDRGFVDPRPKISWKTIPDQQATQISERKISKTSEDEEVELSSSPRNGRNSSRRIEKETEGIVNETEDQKEVENGSVPGEVPLAIISRTDENLAKKTDAADKTRNKHQARPTGAAGGAGTEVAQPPVEGTAANRIGHNADAVLHRIDHNGGAESMHDYNCTTTSQPEQPCGAAVECLWCETVFSGSSDSTHRRRQQCSADAGCAGQQILRSRATNNKHN